MNELTEPSIPPTGTIHLRQVRGATHNYEARTDQHVGVGATPQAALDALKRAERAAGIEKVIAAGPIAPGGAGVCVACGAVVFNPIGRAIQPYCQKHVT